MSKNLQPIKARKENIKKFSDPKSALYWVQEIYETNIRYLQESFNKYSCGKDPKRRVSASYPYIEITTRKSPHIDNRLSYGYLSMPGTYRTTLTHSGDDFFKSYYLEQFRLLLENHDADINIGVSDTKIPIHFALGEPFHLEGNLDKKQLDKLPEIFDLPDLSIMDDSIANGTFKRSLDKPGPIALFTAPRVDVSVQRLKHYTGTSANHFQKFVLYTNYQFYVDEFIRCAKKMMRRSVPGEAQENKEYTSFVEPGNTIIYNQNNPCCLQDERAYTSRTPQMPAYHLKKDNKCGITLINIGVGPSNAKTITDHVAVLRPHVWMMLGHCAGLRYSQNLGDYALAHGYIREDCVLDTELPTWVPLPPLAEIQIALEQAVEEVTGMTDYELKHIMRTGTIATINDRNWELRDYSMMVERFSQSRAIALDMESATIAANGFRFRVPYGTLLCVSDRPLHGELKLPGMADKFYSERVSQHLNIGLLAIKKLQKLGKEKLHSRKLRSFSEVAFQ